MARFNPPALIINININNVYLTGFPGFQQSGMIPASTYGLVLDFGFLLKQRTMPAAASSAGIRE